MSLPAAASLSLAVSTIGHHDHVKRLRSQRQPASLCHLLTVCFLQSRVDLVRAMSWHLVVVIATRVVVFTICVSSALWTLFRAVLTTAPNATANHLMNTTQFDDGDFWQLPNADRAVLIISVGGLGIVALGYVYLAVELLLPPPHKRKAMNPRGSGSILLIKTASELLPSSSIFTRLTNWYYKLVLEWNKPGLAKALVMEILEVTFQSVTLYDMLANGLPTTLVRGYVALMVLNCVYSFYQIVIAWKDDTFYEMVGDAILDAVFAVGFPAITLRQSIADFRGGLRAMALRQTFLPAQRYERRGRLYGDPRQIHLFTTAFETLQITSGVDLLVKVGLNVLACLRWRRIVVTLCHAPQARQPTQSGVAIVPLGPSFAMVSAPGTGTNNTVATQPIEVVPVKHRVVPAYVGVVFLIYGALVAVFASLAISSSRHVCELVPHCGSYAYQWNLQSPSSCPCLVYIEGDLMERIRYDEELLDASQELTRAAEAGQLRTIQLVNRAIQGVLPAAVQRCSLLRQLIVVYSDLKVLPSGWPTTFTKLSYLHVTGRTNARNLESIPSDFFASTPSLRTLYLERHRYLPEVPSFEGLSRLENLFLSEAHSLTRLPSFDHTPRLRTLALINNDQINWLPDLTSVASSLQSVTIHALPLCCSGFLSQGQCNVTYASCYDYYPVYNEHSCYPSEFDLETNSSLVIGSAQFPLISSSSLAVLQPFLDSDAVCNKSLAKLFYSPIFYRPNPCRGVWYRECPNGGICYSFTDEDVECVQNDAVIGMRKTEISLGLACNATEEAWLGCP